MRFDNSLIVSVKKAHHKKLFILQAPLICVSGDYRCWIVPEGFETDFASIPWYGRAFFSPVHPSAYAAAFHDYLYHVRTESRLECDRLFREALACPDCCTGPVERWIMWAGVRFGGEKSWYRSILENGNIMNLNRDVFFKELKRGIRPLFRSYDQDQVDGLSALLDVWQTDYAEYPTQHLAYCLATAYHETAYTMQPVRETLAHDDATAIRRLSRHRLTRNKTYWHPKANGHSYFGRGFVQLTWDYNYIKAGKKLGLNLYENPDRVMEPEIAAKILYSGSIEGWFTKKKLSNFISETRCDYRRCRRVINGMDKARKIAGHAGKFERALVKAMAAAETPAEEKPAPVATPVTVKALREAGSETIALHDKTLLKGVGVSGVGGVASARPAISLARKVSDNFSIEKLQKMVEQGKSMQSLVDGLTDLLTWALTMWPAVLVVAGILLIRNAIQGYKVRIKDEPGIGRLDKVEEGPKNA